MNDAKGYYKLLDLSPTNTKEEIKKKYRELAKELHPDKTNGSTENFIKLKEAYDVLLDPIKKDLYDRGIDEAQLDDHEEEMDLSDLFFMGRGVYMNMDNMGMGNMGNMGTNAFDTMCMNDILESLFDIQNTSEHADLHKNRNYHRDKYSKVNVKLSLDDLIYGAKKIIKYTSYTECEKCNGHGSIPNEILRCLTCNGKGFVHHKNTAHLCPSCNGLSNMTTSSKGCNECEGKGAVKNKQKFEISIAPGTLDNSEDTFHAERLIIKYMHEYDRRITQKGLDIHVSITITIEELLCGFTKNIRIGSKEKPIKFKRYGYFDPTSEKPTTFSNMGIYSQDNDRKERGDLHVSFLVNGTTQKLAEMRRFQPAFCKIFGKSSVKKD